MVDKACRGCSVEEDKQQSGNCFGFKKLVQNLVTIREGKDITYVIGTTIGEGNKLEGLDKVVDKGLEDTEESEELSVMLSNAGEGYSVRWHVLEGIERLIEKPKF